MFSIYSFKNLNNLFSFKSQNQLSFQFFLYIQCTLPYFGIFQKHFPKFFCKKDLFFVSLVEMCQDIFNFGKICLEISAFYCETDPMLSIKE